MERDLSQDFHNSDEKSDDEEPEDHPSSPAAPKTPSHKRSKSSSTNGSQSKKTLHEQLKDVADAQAISRFNIVKMQAKEKTAREAAKRNAKHQSLVDVEMVRLNFQREVEQRHQEAIQHRTHELLMIKKQIELEHMKSSGPFQPPAWDPALH
jgi:N-acetylmuramoyl-L-alanine amidase CwlA